MKRTPLYGAHLESSAKLVDFAGWEMPIQYSGAVDEYHSVRSAAGLFDVSHMGRLIVSGPGALRFLQRVTTNDVSRLALLESHYSMVCNAEGGIMDDIFVYHVKAAEYLLCVNASNRSKIFTWLQQQTEVDSVLVDASDQLAQLALQGPASRDILIEAGVAELVGLRPRGCLEAKVFGIPTLLTRTGYTGELGYELYLPADGALDVWRQLLAHGQRRALKPAGLGARDLLRLEMAYLLYGNDIDETTTPLEAAADWIVAFEKGEFVGRTVLERQRTSGLSRRLVAFELLQKAVPRHGFPILSEAGATVGEVTSGNLSPLLQKGIGLGYVPPGHAAPGSPLLIDVRGRRVPAVVVKPPIYRRRNRGT